MTTDELRQFYEARKIDFSVSLNKINREIILISNIRLIVAVVLLVFLYFTFTTPALGIAVLLLLIGFITLVRKHAKLFDQRAHLQNLVKINQEEMEALSGNFSSFDPGLPFIDPHHPYSHDLDIFGEGSLFQYTNRCHTLHGRSSFAKRLALGLSSAPDIRKNQEAIQELAGKTDFRQHFQASGRTIGEQPQDREQLLAWLKHPSFLYPKPVYRYGLAIFPVITILCVVGAFITPVLKPWAILCALLQWGFLGLHLKSVNRFHDYISRKKNILERYARLLYFLEKETFASPLMKELSAKAHEADVKVKSLAALVSGLDARLNSMTNLVVNSLLLYDLQYVYRLEKWKDSNAGNLQQWIDIIGEAEVLSSFGTFAFNNPSFRYADIRNDLTIETRALGHPLIAAEERVTNDMVMGKEQSVLIVTGANMAGKSTFLRTLGINLVLALNGAPVCAASFQCPLISLRTGMRTADSLKDHASYFYAELNRLKTIMDELRSDKPLLILLDEILKGTNSTDKQAGSIALVKQLLPHPCLAIIATHDLALGELENEYPQKVRNFCFEAIIENDQLSFDYKLKPGLAKKMNATFLMKKMGIIPS